MKKAIIKLECFNGPNGLHVTKPFEFIQIDKNGVGQASSHTVQFNINHDAVNGTIFVNQNNDGVAIATIEGDYELTYGQIVIDPYGSYTENNPFSPNSINESIKASWAQTTNKKITFSIKRVGNLKGNVTISFFVNFKKAK